jgi:hypothetical protein
MRTGFIAFALALAASSAAQAQQLVVLQGRNAPAVARLASEGIGYSVVQGPATRRGFRVQLACTVAYRNATSYCPTAAHDSYCPQARIVCR